MKEALLRLTVGECFLWLTVQIIDCDERKAFGARRTSSLSIRFKQIHDKNYSVKMDVTGFALNREDPKFQNQLPKQMMNLSTFIYLNA